MRAPWCGRSGGTIRIGGRARASMRVSKEKSSPTSRRPRKPPPACGSCGCGSLYEGRWRRFSNPMGSTLGCGIEVLPIGRAVSSSELNDLLEALTPGSQIVQPPPGYLGLWYRRPDGSISGVRRSEEHGITIEVIQHSHSTVRNGYKVHQK